MKEIRYVLERQLTEEGAEELNKLGDNGLAAIKTGKVEFKNEEAYTQAIEVLSKKYTKDDWVSMGEFKFYRDSKDERRKRIEYNRQNKYFEGLRIVKALYDTEIRGYEIIPW